ncbi:MAG: hypothetical protein HC904_15340 [Blastochloris sp.]|nr:hypothetical protein [Blastochloris sp.]
MLWKFKEKGAAYRRFSEKVYQNLILEKNLSHDPRVLEINTYQKSDTLYILATGSSILHLPERAWKDIAQADSFGINFWLYHSLVPTWFSCELPRSGPEAAVMSELLEKEIVTIAPRQFC